MKYGNWTLGQVEALINKLGENLALEILQGQKIVKIEEAIQSLFDKNGRRIPPKRLQNNVCDPDKNFYLKQPQIDYASRLVRFQEAFHPGPCISAAELEGKSEELVEKIKNDSQISNLLKGVYLPIILPQIPKNFDYGELLETTFLAAVEKSYKKQFPNRDFYNYRKGELKKEVEIIKNTRHGQLIEKMKQGITIAIYFPNPLQGFSILASREQMQSLPESLFLCGGFDSATAMVMYPDILARDFHAPGHDLSALCWRSSDFSLFFGAYDDRLCFRFRAVLGVAHDSCSSGLLFLGSA